MTELVGKIFKKTRKVSNHDLTSMGELTILILTFIFCIYAVSPMFN